MTPLTSTLVSLRKGLRRVVFLRRLRYLRVRAEAALRNGAFRGNARTIREAAGDAMGLASRAIGLLLVTMLLPVRVAQGVPPTQATSGRLASLLLQMLDEYDRGGEAGLRRLAAARRMQLRESAQGALIPVILEPRPGISTREIDARQIEALGGHVDAVSDSFLRVLVPPVDARRLAELSEVRVVRTPTIATGVSGFGTIVSESVALTNAATLQNQLQFTGAGVKAAVVDLGFQGLSSVIAAGELPANTISVDFTGTGIESTTRHGVAVSEELLDMAPGVQLYCLKIGDEVDLQNAATYLRQNGIHIANHSVAWVLGSYYDDTGPINDVINASHDNDGVFWSVAAGNAAQQHWRGTWSDPDHDRRLNFSPTENTLSLGLIDGTITVFLNWNQYGNSLTNLDLYVLDGTGAIAGSSTSLQDGPQDPSEAVSFTYDPSRAPYTVEVVWVSGPTSGLDVTLFSFDNTFGQAIAASSTMDPADAHGAVAVGAIPESSYSEATPPLEPYSSQGPTTDGRTKPDFCAPDGTSTYTYGLLGSYGTSFSAPVAAGAAALRQQWLGIGVVIPADLVSSLRQLTAPIGTSTPNSMCGMGKIIAWQPACGAGGELVLVLPALLWLRSKRRTARADRGSGPRHERSAARKRP
ncbi:MAG TPA: S8 family serine peptidase [Myxococcota bacterium]|nr:S8 family serine peptidase [Myxococcota bacterium]